VLDAAWDLNLLPEFTKTQRSPDPDAVDVAVRNALLATSLPSAVVEGIEELDWGGGKAIQHLIVEMWDGEDDTFDIADLTGIAACRNLKSLQLGAARVKDIAPLRGLDRLRRFELNFGTYGAVEGARTIDDLKPLIDLPALREVEIGSHYRDDPANRAVIARLQERGVKFATQEDEEARLQAQAAARKRGEAIASGLAAFKDGKYAEAVKALTPYEASLETSEGMKLQIARRKAAGGR
jgi:hypothetical protein